VADLESATARPLLAKLTRLLRRATVGMALIFVKRADIQLLTIARSDLAKPPIHTLAPPRLIIAVTVRRDSVPFHRMIVCKAQ
jgi:hypothetical protein